MATVNVSRLGGRHKKGGVCTFQTTIKFDEFKKTNDIYQLAALPRDILILSSAIGIITANNGTTGTVDLGFDGGDTLLDGTNLKSAANTVTEVTNDHTLRTTGGTLTIKPTFTGKATAGEIVVVVNYVEYRKQASGQLTEFVRT